MLSREDNELLCRVGPGTPMGELFRRYWMPAMLPSELPGPDCAPVRLRLLGEDLVAFRDTEGRVGVVSEKCPHRRASMFFGRNEEGGLRCVYHGWKFDIDGRCVEMPNESPDTQFAHKVKITAYAAREWGGFIWVYMGPKHLQPELPEIEWSLLPENQRWQSKWYYDANWAQGMEGEIDTSHTSFLHKFFETEGLATNVKEVHPLWQKDTAPRLTVHPTDYGFYYGSRRNADNGQYYWRITQWMLPFYSLIPQPSYPLSCRAYVPIDDEHTMVLYTAWNSEQPMRPYDIDVLQRGAGGAPTLIPGTFLPVQNRANDYGLDRDKQKTSSYSGIFGVNTQDRALVETMGPIVDRENEYLGPADQAVIAARKILIRQAKALMKGEEPLAPSNGSLYRVRPLDMLSPHADLESLVAEHGHRLRYEDPATTA